MTTVSSTPPLARVAIIGFGLIGGSIALALKRALPGIHITAVDTESCLNQERAAEIADVRIAVEDLPSIRSAVAGADVVVLAAPVDAIEKWLPEVLEHASCATDCGSTKRTVCDAALATGHAKRFVPGHPMSGDPAGGLGRARADLFQGNPWILCPDQAEPSCVARVCALAEATGALPVELLAEEHDRAVAITSHVPQLVASALVVQAAKKHAAVAAGPGFRSATRVAGGAERMWRAIFHANADHVSEELGELCQRLSLVRAALAQNPPDTEQALRLLEEARSLK